MTTTYPAAPGDNDSSSENTKHGDDKILAQIRRRYDYMYHASKPIRERGELSVRALTPEIGPWSDDERAARKKEGRPCIHMDQLSQYTKGFMGEVKQTPLGVKIEPGGGGASAKHALMRNDRQRAIEYESKAPHATLAALESAVQRSYGVFGVTIDYKSWDSDQLVVKYRRFANPDLVMWDPDCKEADYADMRDATVEDWMHFEDFKQEFGEDAEVFTDFSPDTVGAAPSWFDFDKQMVRVLEYHCIQKEPFTTKGGRKSYKPVYCVYLTNGIQILSKEEQPVPEIGIFPITGPERFLKIGNAIERQFDSLIAAAIDGQMLFDYYKTNEAEDVGLAPKPKYAGYRGQFGDGEDYKDLNKRSDAYVEFDPVVDPVKGEVLPLPRWDSYTPNIQAMEVGSESARRAIQAALGSYGFTRLDDTNVKSGRAIDRLKQQGELPSYHFVDMYKMAIQRAGRYVDRLLDHIEGDEPMEVALRKEDGTHQVVKINQPSVDESGKPQHLRYRDNNNAEFTATVTDGPSFQSQQQEATAFADTLAASNQPWVMNIMDLVVKLKNLGPIGDQIADRLTPPQFKKDQQNGQMDPQQVQQTIQHYEQALTDAMKQLDEYKQDLPRIQADKEIAMAKIEADKQNKTYDADVKLGIAELTAKTKMQAEQLSTFMLKMDHTLQLIMQDKDHQHEAAMGAAGAAVGQQQQVSDQQHQQDLAAQQQEAAAQQAQQAAQQQPAQ